MLYEGFYIDQLNDYNTLPNKDTEEGAWYIVKKNTLKKFYFYNGDYTAAFNAMQEFVNNRKDKKELTIQLLEFV